MHSDKSDKNVLWVGCSLIAAGIVPLFVAEGIEHLGVDSVGFGFAWGMTMGWILPLIGAVLVVIWLVFRSRN